ncbi:Tat pathway signal protein [Lentzea roselyniae]|uniref:Tat pathway signal protein n=1 Tax=Lentzea roselyniae TaxID=531940 RepID=A0ABP7CMF8_9PSEU
MAARESNERLRTLLAQSCCSGAALAREINTVAAESGERTSYTRTSVGQWLAGTSPRRPVPHYVVEVLSRRLGRPVTLTEAGFPEENSPTVYSVADLSVPAWPDAGTLITRRPKRRAGPITCGQTEVNAARTALRVFSAAERTLGAGHVRRSLTQYLATGVEPLLQGNCTSAKTLEELLSIASQLYYLCGFTWFDDELHGGALRYYRDSLRLAAEAHNAEVYAIALRAMSVQAHMLGHRNQAVQLAEASAETLVDKASPTQAFVVGQLAVARAAAGERRAAVTALCRAERHFERVDDPQVIGTHHAASLAHQRAKMCAALCDRAGATRALMESIRHRPATELRSRAITLAMLAELQLGAGELDRAVATWHRFLDTYPLINSGRATNAVAFMRSVLRPHRRNRGVVNLLARSADLRDSRRA